MDMDQKSEPAVVGLDPGEADADCVRRTLAGDTRAFDRLVERYQRRVLGVAYRLLGNAQDAADAAQEVFLRAFRSLSSLEEPQRFAGWLTRIACNLALNYRRGRRSGVSLSVDEGDTGLNDGAVSPALVEVSHDPTLTDEVRQAIERAIARLPEKQRISLVLFALEGLSHKEVAEILDCGIEAVKWNVFQARKKLKDDLAEYLTE